jgi:membrane associated rhomboid family serine protease
MNNFRPSFFSNIPPVVKNLIMINVVFFIATWAAPGIFSRFGLNVDLTDILGLHFWAATKFNPAQLITYMFMHGGFFHILFNMYALYMFGAILEQVWGPKRFLFYYLVTGFGAGLMQELFWTIDLHSIYTAFNDAIAANSGEVLLKSQDVLSKYMTLDGIQALQSPQLIELKHMFFNSPGFITIGASGSVFGLLLAFGWLFPEQRLYVFPLPVPLKARLFVLIYGGIELFMGVAQFSFDNIAHFAHLGGMLFGALLIIYWKKTSYRH